MEITIDATELIGFADAMSVAPGRLRSEMADATDGLLAKGVGFAQEYAPVQDGTLRSSISIISRGALSGSYGTSIEYAFMREYGGTITARNAPYLVFQVGGHWVSVKSVTQSGTRYMGRSMDSLEPLAMAAYQKAVERALDGMFA